MASIHPDESDDVYYEFSTLERSQPSDYQSTIIGSHFRSWMSLARTVLVILLRIGFVLVQVGSVPVNNVNLILLQNIVDVCWVTIVYMLIGFILAYNGDIGGVVGEGYWIGDANVDKDEAIIGWSSAIIASAICTCGIAGRTHTVGYLVIGFVLSGLVQPLLIHWAWTPNGWVKENQLNGQDVRFRDYAGSGVVHLVGGLSGLIGCMTLGRRILILRDIDDASIASGSSGTVFAGQLLVFVGLQSLSMPNFDREKSIVMGRDLSYVYVNNLAAASSCCLFVVAVHFILSEEAFNNWTVMRCVQAMVAGQVIVSAGADLCSPQAAIGAGCAGGAIFYLVSRQVFRSALEDYCNIVAIHLACAIFGSFLAPLLGIERDMDVVPILLNLAWQFICLIAMLSFVGTVMAIVFLALQCLGLLRNRSEHLNHLRAIIAYERGPPRSYLQRLFFPDNRAVYLQPGSISNVGQRPTIGSRFWKYQNEVDDLEETKSIEMDPAEANRIAK